MLEPPAERPVPPNERIVGLDLLRGVAVLGIPFVNVVSMSAPLVWSLSLQPGSGALDQVCWALVRIGIEGKFIALFSLLFGAGLVLQTAGLEAKGQRVTAVYLRRLAVLAAIGIAHGLLLWFGDVLFPYALVGFVVFWCRRWAPVTQLRVGAVLVGVAAAMQLVVGLLMVGVGEGEPAEVDTAQMPPGVPTWLVEALGLSDPMAMSAALELGAYGEGPLFWSMLFRGLTWLVLLTTYLFGGILCSMAGLFLIGGGLVRLGLFEPGAERWHRALVRVALPLGLGVEVLGTVALWWVGGDLVSLTGAVVQGLTTLSRPVAALGYVGLVLRMAEHPYARGAVRTLARTGRMALTNYLAQTVIFTSLMLHWGGGLYGQLGRPALMGLVVGVATLQLVLSHLWLGTFRMGPAERVWRSLTYLRLRP